MEDEKKKKLAKYLRNLMKFYTVDWIRWRIEELMQTFKVTFEESVTFHSSQRIRLEYIKIYLKKNLVI